MSEILPGIHTIDGLNPSPQFSTNVFLLKDSQGSSYTLIDTGLPPSPGQGGQPGYVGAASFVEAYCAQRQIPLRSIRSILVTHLHRDHSGNLRALAEKTGAKVYAHWIEAAYLAQDPPYTGKGMPPAEPFHVHEMLKDGDILKECFEGIMAVATPGHTPGHVSYYAPTRKILFPGDAVFGEGQGLSVSPPEFTFSTSMALISLRRLSHLDVDIVLTYHGNFVLKGGKQSLAEAARRASTGPDKGQP